MLNGYYISYISYSIGFTSILPTNQAGHQTHHRMTCTHNPFTFQPKAASANASPISKPQKMHIVEMNTGGDSSSRPAVDRILLVMGGKTSLGSTEAEKGLPTKDRGAARRPINSESEKFKVARVAKNIPNRSRENDWIRRYC